MKLQTSIAVFLFFLGNAAVLSAPEKELYSQLLEQLRKVPIERGHGPAEDVSSEVCPLLTAEKIKLLTDVRPDTVARNKLLEENASGFPAGTSHWIVKGDWIDAWWRMVLAVNLNGSGFCQVFAAPVMEGVPNSELLDATTKELAQDREEAPNGFFAFGEPSAQVLMAGGFGQIAKCFEEEMEATGTSMSSEALTDRLGTRVSPATAPWFVVLQPQQGSRSSFGLLYFDPEFRDLFYDDIWPVLEACQP